MKWAVGQASPESGREERKTIKLSFNEAKPAQHTTNETIR